MSLKKNEVFSELFARAALLFCAMAAGELLFAQHPRVIPFLVALILISLLGYIKPGPWRRALLWFGALLSILLPPLSAFLPSMLYEVQSSEPAWALIGPGLALLLLPLRMEFSHFILLLPILALGFCLSWLDMQHRLLLARQRQLQDRLRALDSERIERTRAQKEHQESEIRLATVSERNRIARDIHDNVGHLLTSALLQTAAMCSRPLEQESATALDRLKSTLDEGLCRIRQSVHQLHEDPTDLEAELNRLLDGLTVCRSERLIELTAPPPREHRQCLLAVAREALSNVMRHSNATLVRLTLKEHPALYQLAINDNGTVKPQQSQDGLGLRSIAERVNHLSGKIHIQHEDGFSLFITLPKGGPT